MSPNYEMECLTDGHCRFDVWARALQPKDALQPLEDTLPPLDILMVRIVVVEVAESTAVTDNDLLGLALLYAQSPVGSFSRRRQQRKLIECCLLPSWYTEDGQRILACKSLVDLGQALAKELVRVLTAVGSFRHVSSSFSTVYRHSWTPLPPKPESTRFTLELGFPSTLSNPLW
jgi:hypothetical protein